MNTDGNPEWREVHENAIVVDLHAHPSLKVALFRRQLTQRHRGTLKIFWPPAMRTDFAKLQTGGVDVLLSAVYVPEAPILKQIPMLRVLRYVKRSVWKALIEPPYFEAVIHSLDDLEAEAARHNRHLSEGQRPVQVITSVEELEERLSQAEPKPIALIHTVEGAHQLQGEKSGKTAEGLGGHGEQEIEEEILTNLQSLFERGVASLTLAHFFPNRVVSPVFPFPEKLLALAKKGILQEHDPTKGLTAIGEKVVEKMLELGMIIDVSHCTPKAREQIYDIVDTHKKQALVMATHVGAYEINPSLYNLENWEIKWIADHGGVVGVIFMNYWLMPHETKLGLNFISRTIAHFIEAAGTESVAAFGSDFDGFTDPPDEIVDASQLHKLTQRLMAERMSTGMRRYGDEAVRNILGRNALRMLREGWGRKRAE
jgi:membrane dipeptidase